MPQKRVWRSENGCPECGGRRWACWDLIGGKLVRAGLGFDATPIVDCEGFDYTAGTCLDECLDCGTVVS